MVSILQGSRLNSRQPKTNRHSSLAHVTRMPVLFYSLEERPFPCRIETSPVYNWDKPRHSWLAHVTRIYNVPRSLFWKGFFWKTVWKGSFWNRALFLQGAAHFLKRPRDWDNRCQRWSINIWIRGRGGKTGEGALTHSLTPFFSLSVSLALFFSHSLSLPPPSLHKGRTDYAKTCLSCIVCCSVLQCVAV